MKIKDEDVPVLVARYNAGATFEELALDYPCSVVHMRLTLREKVEVRRPGQQVGKPQTNNTTHLEPTDPRPEIRQIKTSYRGHRRRGRL